MTMMFFVWPPSIFGTVHYQLQGNQDEFWKWPANNVDPCETVGVCKLAFLVIYCHGKNFGLQQGILGLSNFQRRSFLKKSLR